MAFGLGVLVFRSVVFALACVFRAIFGFLDGAFFSAGGTLRRAEIEFGRPTCSLGATVGTLRCEAVDLVRCVDFGNGGVETLDGCAATIRRGGKVIRPA